MNLDFVKFDANGLVLAVAQEAAPREGGAPGRVLMVAWMNREALERTLATRTMTYWSRSRKKLWLKGESSGHTQRVVRWYADCDADALLFEVEQESGACHTGYRSCFFQPRDFEGRALPIAEERLFDPEKTYAK